MLADSLGGRCSTRQSPDCTNRAGLFNCTRQTATHILGCRLLRFSHLVTRRLCSSRDCFASPLDGPSLCRTRKASRGTRLGGELWLVNAHSKRSTSWHSVCMVWQRGESVGLDANEKNLDIRNLRFRLRFDGEVRSDANACTDGTSSSACAYPSGMADL